MARQSWLTSAVSRGLLHRYRPLNEPGSSRKPFSTFRIAVIVLSLFLVALAGHSFTRGKGQGPRPLSATEGQDQEDAGPSDRRLVVIIPVDKPSPKLCKVIASAVALGYPSPILVNWGIDFRDVTKWDGGSHLTKISGGMRYLDAVMRDDAHADEKLGDDDLVLMIDAHDVWFQLPPEVMLQRYHEINAEANAKLSKRWRGRGPMPRSMKQTIVASSQKKCWPLPSDGYDLRCDKLPESPLKADLYGPKTDMDPEFRQNRARYLNSGSFLGPAGDMRHLFRRVLGKLNDVVGDRSHKWSDQGMFAEVFADQEIWRQWQRDHDTGVGDEAMDLVQHHLEFHLGLDYRQQLVVPTVFSEIDGEFLHLSNQTAIDEHSARLNISPVRLTHLPEDVATARNPLADVVKAPAWKDMPLYADLFTEVVPVAMHHNAHVNDSKARITTWWDRPWYFPYLRQLLEFHLRLAELAPLASIHRQGANITYWAPMSNKDRKKPRILKDSAAEPLEEIELDAACRSADENEHWWDEVFRDGKGPLQ
ncbi:hypothetical protein RJ55_02713 [Drechmeria coniospora]|nr:hypothetical protein RJ55_02713 [Drechmeria coniospora]